LRAAEKQQLARQSGIELAGLTAAVPVRGLAHFQDWVAAGMSGEMRYLSDHRAALREDPRRLLPSARSIICVGKLYQTPHPHSNAISDTELGWISRYAWGDDYHDVLRRGLERLGAMVRERAGHFESRICVDTAPLLERAYARAAGLGWTGKNTCLINQQMGSWFFLGELLVSLELEPDFPAPDRCGTCTRCIDACPTQALTPYQLDARRCISYFTIELRTAVPEEHRAGIGGHLFGCDICQDVCPWNGRAPVSAEPAFAPRQFAPPLEKMAAMTESEFRELFRGSAVKRARYSGFLRNVAIAMGNARVPQFRQSLERLSASADPVVADAALWALKELG
jgi:epoxyqueuosine reductase